MIEVVIVLMITLLESAHQNSADTARHRKSS